MISAVKTFCSVCRSKNLVEILEMPRFPFTGIFVESAETPKFHGVDQAFDFCPDCGHGQIRNIISPELVYSRIYTHRTSASPMSASLNDFFARFLRKLIGPQKFKCILEVGCNDLYLLNQVCDLADQVVGVDPIWQDGQPTNIPTNGKVLGKFVEQVDLDKEIGVRPDLILSSHTLEHVDDPRSHLQAILEKAAPGALILIEVPGFDTLLRNFRFDQVFHQHIHYFCLASIEKMFGDLACDYVDHTFNHNVWGGTMLIAFRKGTGASVASGKSRFKKPAEGYVRARYQYFRQQMDQCMRALELDPSERIYAFGGAQMLPTIAYHLETDFSFLEGILDDNEERIGLTYPYINSRIKKASGTHLEDCTVLLTALDSVPAIMKRLFQMNARRIVLPLNILS